MQEHFLANIDSLDFSFVSTLSDDELNMFFEVLDLAIESMRDTVRDDLANGSKNLSMLSLDQLDTMTDYYSAILEIYTDYELYEECGDILYILDSLKDYKEKVGSMLEKH